MPPPKRRGRASSARTTKPQPFAPNRAGSSRSPSSSRSLCFRSGASPRVSPIRVQWKKTSSICFSQRVENSTARIQVHHSSAALLLVAPPTRSSTTPGSARTFRQRLSLRSCRPNPWRPCPPSTDALTPSSASYQQPSASTALIASTVLAGAAAASPLWPKIAIFLHNRRTLCAPNSSF